MGGEVICVLEIVDVQNSNCVKIEFCSSHSCMLLHRQDNILHVHTHYIICIEGKTYSRTDIISDRRLQRFKHSSNCARLSEQQDMLALG